MVWPATKPAAPERRLAHIVDTSTIGVAAARAIDALLAEAGVAYVDAPVSGGRLFEAIAEVHVPEGVDLESVKSTLEDIATDLMVDIHWKVERAG